MEREWKGKRSAQSVIVHWYVVVMMQFLWRNYFDFCINIIVCCSNNPIDDSIVLQLFRMISLIWQQGTAFIRDREGKNAHTSTQPQQQQQQLHASDLSQTTNRCR